MKNSSFKKKRSINTGTNFCGVNKNKRNNYMCYFTEKFDDISFTIYLGTYKKEIAPALIVDLCLVASGEARINFPDKSLDEFPSIEELFEKRTENSKDRTSLNVLLDRFKMIANTKKRLDIYRRLKNSTTNNNALLEEFEKQVEKEKHKWTIPSSFTKKKSFSEDEQYSEELKDFISLLNNSGKFIQSKGDLHYYEIIPSSKDGFKYIKNLLNKNKDKCKYEYSDMFNKFSVQVDKSLKEKICIYIDYKLKKELNNVLRKENTTMQEVCKKLFTDYINTKK